MITAMTSRSAEIAGETIAIWSSPVVVSTSPVMRDRMPPVFMSHRRGSGRCSRRSKSVAAQRQHDARVEQPLAVVPEHLEPPARRRPARTNRPPTMFSRRSRAAASSDESSRTPSTMVRMKSGCTISRPATTSARANTSATPDSDAATASARTRARTGASGRSTGAAVAGAGGSAGVAVGAASGRSPAVRFCVCSSRRPAR